MTKTVVALVLSSFALVGSASAAVKYYRLDETEFLTDFSGTRDNVERRGGDGDFKALFEIQIAESGDAPCYLRARSRHINNYEPGTYEYDDCSESDSSRKTVGFGGTDTYIRGVAVCVNSSGSRVKGVRLYGATLNRSTGTLTNESGHREFERTNCNTWKLPQYCPAGQVATQVRISYENYYSISEINGLALVCRAVEPS